jgi:hypothetical protein
MVQYPKVAGSNPAGATFSMTRRSSMAERRKSLIHNFVDHFETTRRTRLPEWSTWQLQIRLLSGPLAQHGVGTCELTCQHSGKTLCPSPRRVLFFKHLPIRLPVWSP